MLTVFVEATTSFVMKKPAPKPKMHVLGVRVDPELKAAVEKAAAADQRSVSQWIALKLGAALKEGKKP